MTVERHERETTDSTNSEARRHALSGGAIPAVFTAREQTAGRGRMGRSFYSPKGSGLYYSILLPFPEDQSCAVTLTAAASVAAAEAISEVLRCEVQIKWVNDLYRDGKKVAGILCESFPHEGRRLAIIGIGINLFSDCFPDELSQTAAALCPRAPTHEWEPLRQALTEALTERLLAVSQAPNDPCLMARYRARSLVLGQAVRFTQNGVTREGIAEGITDQGALTVRCRDGSLRELQSGEITLRLQTTEQERNRP